MSKDEVSRRVVLGAIGVGAASTAIAVEGLRPPRPIGFDHSPADTARSEPAEAAQSLALLAPLTVGARLGRWTVEQLVPLQDGALSVVLSDSDAQRFQLDVCARDDQATCSAPGKSELFEVYLANHGDGATSTYEDHGLAAMALADLIRANEQHVERCAFQTLRQRVEAQRARLHIT